MIEDVSCVFWDTPHAPWPGVEPPAAPWEMVTFATRVGTLWAPCKPYRCTCAVYRVPLVKPSFHERTWSLDFRQGHHLVTMFCTWELDDADLLWAAALANATPDAPAFRWSFED